MIKGNESDIANIVFEILARKEFRFLLINSVTRYPILMGFASKRSIFSLPECGVENLKLKIFDK